jgi:hypothetical protein
MQAAVLRRVVSPILVVTPSNKPHGFITVPQGSLIETPDGFHEPGLIPIKLAGQELLAFTRDIEECCEPLLPQESN